MNKIINVSRETFNLKEERNDILNILKCEAKNLGIEILEDQLIKFQVYMDFLIEYNLHTNLTTITNPEDIIVKHFLDSIVIGKYIDINSNIKVVDIGSGAGFPGVPIKICNPGVKLTLIDSLNKRVNFLKVLVKKINIEADIFHARAEELSLSSQFREKFDLAVSRAVAPLNLLLEYCLPYVKVGGIFVALKGSEISEELNKSLNAIKILGGKLKDIISFNLPFSKGKRTLVIVEKKFITSKNYPRKNSKINISPL